MELELRLHSVDVCDHGVRRLTLESCAGSGALPVAVADVPECLRDVARGGRVRLRVSAYDASEHEEGLTLASGTERGDLDEVAEDAAPASKSVGACTLCGTVTSSRAVEGGWAVMASAGGLGLLVVTTGVGVESAPREGSRVVWCVESL